MAQPKKPVNCYLLYLKDRKASFIEKAGGNYRQGISEASKAWKDLSVDEKERYYDQAQELNVIYEREMESCKIRLGVAADTGGPPDVVAAPKGRLPKRKGLHEVKVLYKREMDFCKNRLAGVAHTVLAGSPSPDVVAVQTARPPKRMVQELKVLYKQGIESCRNRLGRRRSGTRRRGGDRKIMAAIPWTLYLADVKAAYRETSGGDYNRFVSDCAKSWRSLSADEKGRFVEKAQELIDEYERRVTPLNEMAQELNERYEREMVSLKERYEREMTFLKERYELVPKRIRRSQSPLSMSTHTALLAKQRLRHSLHVSV